MDIDNKDMNDPEINYPETESYNMGNEEETGFNKIPDRNLHMVAGGNNCPGHVWRRVSPGSNMYYCPRCDTYMLFNDK